MPRFDAEALNRLYTESEQVDKDHFAEMRSNILLVAGEHYNKVNRRLANQVRTTHSRTELQKKLRLIKNHTFKVSRQYKSFIMDGGMSIAVRPQRDTELQDQKDAELNKAVWEDGKKRYKFKSKNRQYVSDFVDIGEVCVKMFWDEDAGEFKGYEPKVDEEGQPVQEHTGFDEMGQPTFEPVPDETKPIFSGEMVFERVFGFNLLRRVGIDAMDDSDVWIVRKLMKTKDVKRKYADVPEIDRLKANNRDTFVVFDADRATYQKVRNMVMVREYFWKPSKEYPQGWYVYATDTVILEEGPLPGGVWPLVWKGFNEYPTMVRGRSIIKVVRPYQAEINRASSTMALQQITLGDDKVLYQAGTKLSPGSLLPGVRGISFQGQMPQILQGRTGAQYLDYVLQQTSELYDVVDLAENKVEDQNGNLDVYALLFRAASQKRKFKDYIEKFEEFSVDFADLYLRLCKLYLPDDMLIPAVGNREIVNIAEFRKTTDLSYQIDIVPQDDTLETQLGRQLTFQHALQYVGKQLEGPQIGRILKNLPFANAEDSFDDLTMDEDNVKNDMLAMERGEQPEPNETNPTYTLQRVSSRMKQGDFRFLPPQVQQLYQQYKQIHVQIIAQQAEQEKALQNEFIPIDGSLVKVDLYVQDPQNPEGTAKRARVPQRALEWLMTRLEQQGASMDKLESMNSQALAEIAQQFLSGQGQVQQGGNPLQAS